MIIVIFFVVVLLPFAILIWLFTGAHGDFWPKWVFVVTLFMFTRRAFGRRSRHRRSLPPPPDVMP